MTDQKSSSVLRTLKAKRVARRILEIITAITLLGVALYWPSTNTGRLYLVALVVVLFVGLSLLRKWPSV
jgi:uncharacterized membrane protein YqjE